jgi:ubiquinone/menaquinone biosynthesis C-methylase UbiE
MILPNAQSDDARPRAWLEVREPLERQFEPLGRVAIAALGLVQGERVLDIGCGIGTTPLALACAVGTSGSVMAIDVLAAALDVLRIDGNLPGNVTLTCADAASFPFMPASFDAAFSRFGVMFFADPMAAFTNLRRALRPGGRIGFVCWRALVENELDEFPLRAAAPFLPAAVVAAAASSGPFSFSDPEIIRNVLMRAGFIDVEIAPHDELVGSGSLEAMVDVCSRVGALGRILRDHPDYRRGAVPALERAFQPLDGPDGPRLNAATWLVTANAPG